MTYRDAAALCLDEQRQIDAVSYRQANATSQLERDLAAEELRHLETNRRDREEGRDSGLTDFERRQLGEEIRVLQLRGERIPPWLMDPSAARR